MGLLDILNSDEGQQALGLLAAAGPSATPMSFGQRLYGAMQQDQARRTEAEDRKLKRLLTQAQINDFQAQAKFREAQASKPDNLQAMLSSIVGNQGSPSQYDLAGNGMSLGGVREPMTPRPAGLAGATADQLLALKAAGLDARELWQDAQRGLEIKPGTGYLKNGVVQYADNPEKGISYRNGRVSLIPGSIEAQSALAGATKEAEARGSGMYSLVQGVDEKGNPTIVGTTTGIADKFRQPTEQAQQLPLMEQVRAAMLKNGDKSANFDIGGVRGTIGQPAGGSGIRTGLGPADTWKYDEKRGLMVNGIGETRPITKADGTPAGSPSDAEEAKRNDRFLAVTQQARAALLSGPTESGIGTLVDKGAGFFGATPKGAAQAAKLSTISGWLTSNVPRMEGPQSNVDVENYKVMAAAVGDSTKPVAIRLAALDEVEKLIKKYSAGNPVASQSKADRQVVRTGRDASGKRVVQYSDGSIEHAD